MTFILMLFFALPVNAECPVGVPIESSQMTPEGVRAWLSGRQDKIKSVGDFICCLPPKFLKGYFISHASIAGQSGSPESPRVIFNDGPIQGSTDRNVMFASANGGAEYLSQHDNLEFAFYRKSSERLEYFDAGRENGSFKLSAKNPPLCMTCHGHGEVEPKHGPLPIFDPFGNWPRFVGGAVKCFKEEDRLQIHQQKVALEAVRDNPRFRCLDKTFINEDIKNLSLAEANFVKQLQSTGTFSGFDSFLFSVNNQRVARVVRDTPDYEAYKYVILGEQMCDLFGKIEEWIPPAVLKNHNRLATVDSEYARVETADQMKELIAAAKDRAAKHRERTKRELSKMLKDDRSGLDPVSQPFVCEKPSDTEEFIVQLVDIIPQIQNPTLRAYMVDAAFKRKPLEARGATSAMQRFLFEARGIDMGSWGMEPTPNQYRIANEIAFALLEKEPKSTLLRKMYDEYQKALPDTDLSDQFCEKLKKASYAELSKLKKPQGSTVAPQIAR